MKDIAEVDGSPVTRRSLHQTAQDLFCYELLHHADGGGGVMQILAGIIKDMKDIAEVDGSPVTDCVLSVPAYFVESERYAMLNAARIAGVNCLRLLNDTTAIALAYGIYKTDLPDTEAVNVAFVDVGHNAYQVRLLPLLCPLFAFYMGRKTSAPC
jgi:hypothetical protein